jgi:hypothetical protein
VWDLAYYLFLRIVSGWPRSLFDWDVLFLIPLPWWGPVLAPALIALLMIIGGGLLGEFDRPRQPLWPGRVGVGCGALGVLLALGVFMADAVRALPGGEPAVRDVLPVRFPWPLFLVAWGLMAAPVVELAGRVLLSRRARFERNPVVVAPNP